MAGFAWKRRHTVAAAGVAVLLVGVGTAVARQGVDVPVPLTAVSASASAPVSPTPEPTTAAPSRPAPDPVNPLTGKKPVDHRVIAVKIENIAAARPLVGLGSADIVVVEEVEGSLTRLIGIYHTDFPRRVGPVRSARNTDVGLLPMFGAPGLVYSGANSRVQRNIEKSSIVPLQRSDRDRSRVAPHNVFVDLEAVEARAKKVGAGQDIGWTFATGDPRWDKAARDRSVTTTVGGDTFSFRAAEGRYLVRWNGATYADGDSGKRASTDNVVIMSVTNKPDGNADVNGARSVRSDTTGKGKVVIHRDGRTLTGTWRRAGATEPMRFVGADGRDIPLKPGRTWVLLRG